MLCDFDGSPPTSAWEYYDWLDFVKMRRNILY